MDIELRGIEVASLFKFSHLSIPANEKVLIYGPSGSGKTSLLHLIGGLWKPTRGEVFCDGQNLCTLSDLELSEFRKNKIGFVFQKMNLLEHMTCAENLELVTNKLGENAESVLKKVGLSDKLHVRAGNLSLGEQQRLAVVRVLLQNPAVILADEPTSSLDEANAKKVMELLLETSQKKTLIVVSHDSRLQKYFGRNLNFAELVQ
ncbi:MAG: ATP-binding cassette domain-containing protein [Bdellovibrionales bacterium]|nr:ATP-binding cassette domain-containing protein [Bdellovibrionales bacterium]